MRATRGKWRYCCPFGADHRGRVRRSSRRDSQRSDHRGNGGTRGARLCLRNRLHAPCWCDHRRFGGPAEPALALWKWLSGAASLFLCPNYRVRRGIPIEQSKSPNRKSHTSWPLRFSRRRSSDAQPVMRVQDSDCDLPCRRPPGFTRVAWLDAGPWWRAPGGVLGQSAAVRGAQS